MCAYEDPRRQQPGETEHDWRRRLKQMDDEKALRAPGGYLSTRNADGSSRGGAAAMFERYGWF